MKNFAFRCAVLGAAAVAVALGATAAQATTVHDRQHDLLNFNQTGTHTTDGFDDLDVKSATVSYNDKFVFLSATMYGNIGATTEGFYVWGVDTGTGTDFFQTQPHPDVGKGVKFDTFIVLKADDTGSVNYLSGEDSEGVESVTHAGQTIRAVIARDALEDGATVDISKWTFNIWPRVNGLTDNDQITDFAPNDRNFNGSASVPEPASWALMIAGFGLAGATLRRRRSSPLAA
jgi:hypothetical protein